MRVAEFEGRTKNGVHRCTPFSQATRGWQGSRDQMKVNVASWVRRDFGRPALKSLSDE